MKNNTFCSLLEEKREDIIKTIKQTAIESFTPGFYGVYEIYINEEDGHIHIFKWTEGEPYQLKPPMRYLYSIPSHAIATKEDHFEEWLTKSGERDFIETCDDKEMAYQSSYNFYMLSIQLSAREPVVFAETIHDIICDLYKNNKEVTYDAIQERYY